MSARAPSFATGLIRATSGRCARGRRAASSGRRRRGSKPRRRAAPTTSRSCVIATIAEPLVAQAPASSATSSAQVRASWPNVGSSSTSTRGRGRERRGDRQPALLAARERVRVRARRAVRGAAARAARRRAPRSRRRPSPSARGPTSSSSRTVLASSWCSGSWNTVPMRVSSCRDDQRIGDARRRPPASAGAATSAPDAGRQQPREGQPERRLARAVRAGDREHRAGAHVEVDAGRRRVRRAPARTASAARRQQRRARRARRAAAGRRAGCRAPTRPRRRARRPRAPSTASGGPSATTPPSPSTITR